MTLTTLLVMTMDRHLILTRRNQQTFVISKADRYFFTLCQPCTPSATCMYESVGFSHSKFYLKTTYPIIYTTITKRDSKYLHNGVLPGLPKTFNRCAMQVKIPALHTLFTLKFTQKLYSPCSYVCELQRQFCCSCIIFHDPQVIKLCRLHMTPATGPMK